MTPNADAYALIVATGKSLLHFLWQGLLIASLLELVLASMRRNSPDARYTVRCAALFCMAVAPIATFALVLDPLAHPVQATAHASTPLLAPWLSAPWLWIVIGWSLGASALSARLLGGWMHTRTLRHHTRSANLPAHWQRTFDRIASDLGVQAVARAVDSAAIGVPTMIGWLKPVILIPARVLTGLSEDQIEAVLAHELAHVRRCDYLVNVLQSAVEALLFYHPAVWRVSSGIRAEREFCCDDVALSVTGDGVSYARALTELESWRTPSVGVGVSTLGGSLMQRIQRLVGTQTELSTPRPRRVLQAFGTLLVAGTVGATALGLSHDPAPQDGRVHPNVTRPVRVHVRESAPLTVENHVRAPWNRTESTASPQAADESIIDLIERIHERLHARLNVVREFTAPHAVRDFTEEVHTEHDFTAPRFTVETHRTKNLHPEHDFAAPQHPVNTDLHEVHETHDRQPVRVELHRNMVERLHEHLQEGARLHEEIVETLHDRMQNREIGVVEVENVNRQAKVLEHVRESLSNLELREVNLDRAKLHEHLVENVHEHLNNLKIINRKVAPRVIDTQTRDLRENPFLKLDVQMLDDGALRIELLEQPEMNVPLLKNLPIRVELDIPEARVKDRAKPRHLELVQSPKTSSEPGTRPRALLALDR